MSQLILDDQLNFRTVLKPLQKWITVQRLQDLRPTERILDDRVPEILLTLKTPTFVTIDQDFWHRQWCHPGYCILYFALSNLEQKLIPSLLRDLFHLTEFQTRGIRMGKIVRVSTITI